MAHTLSTGPLARRCAQRPRSVIGIWILVILIASTLIMGLLGDALTTEMGFTNSPESETADNLLDERMYSAGQVDLVTEIILISSSDHTVDDGVFRQFAEDIYDAVSSSGAIAAEPHYYITDDPARVSLDHHTLGLVFQFTPDKDTYEHFWNAFPNPLNTSLELAEPKAFRVTSFRAEQGSSPEIIIVRSDEITVDDDRYRGFVEDLFFETVFLGREVVFGGINYYLADDSALVSADQHATIIPLMMDNDEIDRLLGIIDQARQNDSFDISITGNATLDKDFQQLSEDDLRTGELMFGLPIAVVVLLLVFGTLVAAAVPLVLALICIIIALGMAALFGQAFDISVFLVNMVFTIGLAVGIDYSLFIIARYREERVHGHGIEDAIARAGETASRAMLFSGMTVILALTGLLLVPLTLFLSLGLGAILVVIVAVAASLTLLPAVISLLGDRIDAGRIPLVMRSRITPNTHRSGMWETVSRWVMRAPMLSIVISAGLLITATIPLLGMEIGGTGVSTFPDGFEAKKGYMALQQDFSVGLVDEAIIVIDGPIDDPAIQSAVTDLKTMLEQDSDFGPVSQQINVERDLMSLSTPISSGDESSPEAISTVKRLRRDYIPSAFQDAPARALVAGGTAIQIDYIDAANDSIPIVFPFVLLLSFVLLMLVFRSIVVPVKAMIMNLLSVGSAYGLMVLVFVEGVGDEIFGFQQVDTIEAWVPVFLFAVLFGLSMDYHVFLLSRIRERFNQTADNTESVAHGIRSTGRLITGAALIMVAVFSGFASGDLVMFQQMGFGLAVSIFLDATIVRSVLVPASMRLLGHWNWYLPVWLGWLPRISVEEEHHEPPAHESIETT